MGGLTCYIVRRHPHGKALAVVKLGWTPQIHDDAFSAPGRVLHNAIHPRHLGVYDIEMCEGGRLIWSNYETYYHFEVITEAQYDSYVDMDIVPEVWRESDG